MGWGSGTASGSAASTGGSGMSAGQQAGMQAGMGIVNAGAGMGQNQDQMLTALARTGPPPQLNTAQTPVAGQDIVGKYGSNLKPPNVNYRSRQDAQMNPSVGQLLTGRA
jgi:hypothetical protein